MLRKMHIYIKCHFKVQFYEICTVVRVEQKICVHFLESLFVINEVKLIFSKYAQINLHIMSLKWRKTSMRIICSLFPITHISTHRSPKKFTEILYSGFRGVYLKNNMTNRLTDGLFKTLYFLLFFVLCIEN